MYPTVKLFLFAAKDKVSRAQKSLTKHGHINIRVILGKTQSYFFVTIGKLSFSLFFNFPKT